MDDEAKWIAEGLKTGDRIRLLAVKNGVADRTKFSARAMERLVALGLAYPTDWTSQGVARIELTENGIRVRAHLEATREGE